MCEPLGDLGYIFYPVVGGARPSFDIRPPLSGELANLSSGCQSVSQAFKFRLFRIRQATCNTVQRHLFAAHVE